MCFAKEYGVCLVEVCDECFVQASGVCVVSMYLLCVFCSCVWRVCFAKECGLLPEGTSRCKIGVAPLHARYVRTYVRTYAQYFEVWHL